LPLMLVNKVFASRSAGFADPRRVPPDHDHMD
jgi:hypothetical protein